MTDFAKLQLLKYGWTEGKGLGKHENGIVEALKPKLKFDTTGIGHDASEYQWWESVYNKATNNVIIDTKSQNVQMSVKNKNAVNIKTNKSELNWEKIEEEQFSNYGNFIKTSTLENGKVTTNSVYLAQKYEMEEEKASFNILNDEDLFNACGGRTAHKAARHGLKLNGKLARIERQEQNVLNRMNEIGSLNGWIQVEKKKKRKNNRSLEMNVEKEVDQLIPETNAPSTMIAVDLSLDNFTPARSKKTRRKAKRRLDSLNHLMKTSLVLSVDTSSDCDKKSMDVLEERVSSKMSEKYRKRKKQPYDNLRDETMANTENTIDDNIEQVIEPALKKCKNEILNASVLNCKIEKRKKKRKSRKEKKKVEKLFVKFETLNLIETNNSDEKKCKNNEMSKKK